MPLWSFLLIIGLAFTTLFFLRLSAGHPLRSPLHDILDCLVGALLWGATALMTLRPAASALFWAVLAGGLLLADYTKRAVLREPVVFADASELIQLAFHPRFYLPYVHPLLFYGAGGGLLLLTAWLFSIETPMLNPASLMPRLYGAALLVVPVLLYFTRTGVVFFERCLSLLRSDSVLEHDLAKFGILGTFLVHTVKSRFERPTRQALCKFGSIEVPTSMPPIVLVQAESFFDIERFDPAMKHVLPNFSQCQAASYSYGQLNVAAWGANTIRSEFSALSGIPSDALGLDSFNPYYAFARKKIDTLVWKLRTAGYQTICVHPYDRSFYGRHKVMPNLGFDYFYGREAFPNEKGRFVSDEAVAKWVNNFVNHATMPVFVFVITVANHGPYGTQGLSEYEGYIEGIKATDRMIKALTSADWITQKQGILTVYGDHQPSLPELLTSSSSIGLATDYFIFDPTAQSRLQNNISIHQLGKQIASCLAARSTREKEAAENHTG